MLRYIITKETYEAHRLTMIPTVARIKIILQ